MTSCCSSIKVQFLLFFSESMDDGYFGSLFIIVYLSLDIEIESSSMKMNNDQLVFVNV